MLVKNHKQEQEWCFHFIDSPAGWNSVVAGSLKEAQELAVKEYGNVGKGVDLDSFWTKEGNEAKYEMLLAAFW